MLWLGAKKTATRSEAAASEGTPSAPVGLDELTSKPLTLKNLPLRTTARLFAVADLMIAFGLLIARYFVAMTIVAVPLFQTLVSCLYVLIASFGMFQVFTEAIPSFTPFIIWYGLGMAVNLLAAVILAAQVYDMGLMSWNCGDVEICVPFVKSEAIAGWTLACTCTICLLVNCCMLRVYLDLQRRVLLEEEYAKTHIGSLMGMECTQARTHSQPFNYSSTVETSGRHSLPGQMMKMIRTPIPRRVSADPDGFLSPVTSGGKGTGKRGMEMGSNSQDRVSKVGDNDSDSDITDWANEISHSSRLNDAPDGNSEDASSSAYHSFPISPLDAPGAEIHRKYYVS